MVKQSSLRNGALYLGLLAYSFFLGRMSSQLPDNVNSESNSDHLLKREVVVGSTSGSSYTINPEDVGVFDFPETVKDVVINAQGALVLVSHDLGLAERCDRVIHMEAGRIRESRQTDQAQEA